MIDFTIPEKYFVYKDKTELEFLNLESLLVKRIEYPTSRVRQDPFFKKKLAVFEGPSQILVTFEVPPEAQVGKRMLEAVLHFQGCSDTLCYPEEARPIIFNFEIGGTSNLEPRTSNSPNEHLSTMMGDAPFCDSCGHVTVRNGSCYRCLNCGNSMGCS